MENAFSLVLNMSLTGSLVILLVLAGRFLLRKQPKIFSYALWGVVLFRLLCPVSISAPVSALDVVRPAVEQTSQTVSRVSFVADIQPTPVAPQSVPAPVSQETAIRPAAIAAWVWLVGMGVMGLYSLASYAALRRKLIGATPCQKGILLSDYVDTPFVLGIFRPKIYLPTTTPPQERRFIQAHEQHHVRRLDHIWKLLAYLALCVHWFNPLVWLSFVLAGKDMEMSCDEAVIRKLGEHTRADYATALLRLSTKRTVIRGTPLAFGEGDTKGRVKNMANWKKPKIWVSLLCAVLCIAVLAACAVNPREETQKPTPAESVPETTAEAPLPTEGGTFRQLTEQALPEGYIFVNMELMTVEESRKPSDQPHSVVGGLVQYEIPDGLVRDRYFQWLEEMGIPDVDDPTLAKIGASGGHCDWLLEVFSDVPDGQPQSVHRYHEFTVLTDQDGHANLMDMWFDATQIDYEEFAGFLTFHDVDAPEEVDYQGEAFERCMEVIGQVGASSRHLHCEAEGPGGSTAIVDSYKIKDGDCLHIEQVDGSYQEAVLVVGDQHFYGTGDIGGEIAWKSITLEEYSKLSMQWLWLGSTTLFESRGASYQGTMREDMGELHCYKFNEPYAGTRWGVVPDVNLYQVGFQFDHQDNFLWVSVAANLGTEKEVLAKESIVSLDESTVRAAIDREYARAQGTSQ